MEVAFQAFFRPLYKVTSFKYLGRVLTSFDNKWLAGVSNLRKAWSKWARFSRIWGQEGTDP